jgi:Dolichyl-phosphate-mannose-protein mannosyltransferase
MTRSFTVDIAETTVSGRTAGSAAARRPIRISAETLLFAGLLLVYLVVAAWLVFLHHSIMEDALSRVANAQYVLFSREPKLANLGFVWTPLPSLLVLPFLPLKALWPPLVEQGFLANILSAVAMAASARVLVGLLDDMRVPRRAAFTLVVAFGFQPMIVWFGANGMTEALLILFLLLSSRCLVRWLDDDDFRHLMAAGGYLALGYLARYEVLASGCAAVALIAVVTWRRLSKEQVNRRSAAFADTLLVGAPLLAAFLFWAIASWVIVGHPFDQFSSAYGNSALVETGGGPAAVNPTLIVMQWLVLAPVLPLVVVAASAIAVRRRDIVLIPPVALLTSVLAFEALVYFAGSLFGFLRYQIVVVPLLVILAGYLFSRRRTEDTVPDQHFPERDAPTERLDLHRIRAHATPATPAARSWRSALIPAAAAALLLPGIVVSSDVFMNHRVYANQEWGRVRPAVLATLGQPEPIVGSVNGLFDVDRKIAAFLDAKRLPPGSVVVDSGSGFAVIAASANPRQFVITSDLDFQGAVVDPVGHGVQYMLLNRSNSQYDAVAARWPDLAADRPTAFWARRDVVFPSGGQAGAHEWALWGVAS